MKLISYAQNQEDIVLHRALRGVARGFYIDVGAQHPISDSVTKLFYERGWSGINIDPVPQWFELLQSDRPHDINLRLAAGSAPGRKKFFAIANTGLSTDDAELAQQHAKGGYGVDEMDVEVRTLDDICVEYNVQTVHFLKIDVEGAEVEVIRGFAFDKIRPWIVLVEAVAPVAMQEGNDAYAAVETHAGWEPLLLAHGYKHVYSDGLNRFYLANEHQELYGALSLQPNPLDAFIRNEEWIKHERILQLEGQMKQLRESVHVVEQRHQAEAFQGLLETAEKRLHRIAELEQDNARLVGVASVHEHRAAASEHKVIALERSTAILASDIEKLKSQNAVFENDVHALRCQNNDMAERLRNEDGVLIDLQTQMTGMRSERDRYSALLHDTLHSHSWRITAPLRGISRIVKPNRLHPKASAPHVRARSVPRRLIRKLLLKCIHIAHRHPRLHACARAAYKWIPGLHGHLSAFARTNFAHTAQGDPGQMPPTRPLLSIDKQLPSGAAEVHRRVSKRIKDQRRPD